jgi:signal transduction histidine kinase
VPSPSTLSLVLAGLRVFALPLRVRWQAVVSRGGRGGRGLARVAPNLLAVATSSSAGDVELGTSCTTVLTIGFAAVATGRGDVRLAGASATTACCSCSASTCGALNAEQLEKTNGELARLNAEKNEFMAVAAHDLRAPLGIVRGTCSSSCETGKL